MFEYANYLFAKSAKGYGLESVSYKGWVEMPRFQIQKIVFSAVLRAAAFGSLLEVWLGYRADPVLPNLQFFSKLKIRSWAMNSWEWWPKRGEMFTTCQ